MELITLDVEAFHLGVGDFDAFVVGSRVECAFYFETGFGRGCGDQFDDGQPIGERPAAPVLRDVAEQAVLDLVPLRRAWRIVVDLEYKPGVIGGNLRRGVTHDERARSPVQNAPLRSELTAALAATLHANLEAAHQAELAEMQARLRSDAEARLKALVDEAEKKVRDDSSFEKQALERQLADERGRREAAQRAELALRQEKSTLENRARELDLEVARRVDTEKLELETSLRRTFAEQQDLKLKEKEKLIDDLRRALEEAKRKTEQGSQERQGEVPNRPTEH
jgi:hypothetical protein